jgi:hypothetical protein
MVTVGGSDIGMPVQAMASVGTSIVPPGSRLPPVDTPGTSATATPPQVTASLHDFAVSLAQFPTRASLAVLRCGLKLSQTIAILVDAGYKVRR